MRAPGGALPRPADEPMSRCATRGLCLGLDAHLVAIESVEEHDFVTYANCPTTTGPRTAPR